MKTIERFTLIILGVFSVLGNLAFASSSIKPYVATGFTVTKDYKTGPLIAVSQTNGNTWSYPSLAIPMRLDSANCNQTFCVINGFSSIKPALSVSIDQGKSWSFVEPLMRDDGLMLSQNVSCDSRACYIVGYRDERYLPVIAASETGLSWEYRQVPNNYYAKADHISCTDKSCVITGKYSLVPLLSFPFVGVSKDHGKSWKFPPLGEISAPGNSFSSVHCHGDLCAISGAYAGNEKTPLVLISHDAGQSWHLGKVPALPDLKQKVNGITIDTIKCSESWCTAVGNFYNEKHFDSLYPAVIVSKDKGETWSYPTSLFSLVPKEVGKTLLLDLSCHDDVCMAVGGFVPKDACVTIPLVVASTDKGETWMYQPINPSNASLSSLKSCDLNGLYNVSCDENSCITAGMHQDAPLLAVTQDKGKTWFYPFDKKALPSHFSHGGFQHGTNQYSKIK